MSDPLTDLLTRELAARAADVTPTPALASHVLRQARTVRRRRSAGITALAAVAAAAVVLAVSDPGHILGTGPTPPAVHTPAPVTPKIVAPQPGPIRIPYVINGTTGVSGSAGRAVAHLGGRAVRLPQGWNVLAATRAGDGVLVEAILGPVPTPKVHSVVAYVSADGGVTQLPALTGGALPVNADGSLVVGRARPSAASPTPPMSFVQLPSGTLTQAPALPAGYSLVGSVGPRSLLVDQNSVAQYGVWTASTGAVQIVPAVTAGITGDWVVTATDLTGQILLTGSQGVRDIHLGPPGRTWTSTVTTAVILQAGPRFSPDGSRLALVSGDRLLFLSTSDGSVQARSAAFPAGADIRSVVWEDDGDVLAQTDSSLATHSHVFRCSAQGAQCLELPTPTGHLLLAGR